MNVKKSISVLLLCCFMQITGTSQIRYEDLEKYSKAISEILFRSHYKGDNEFNLTEQNFNVFFSTKLASYGYYHKEGQGEALIVTENIDFSKVNSIVSEKYSDDGPAYVTLYFDTPIEVKVIDHEQVINIVNAPRFSFLFQTFNSPDMKLLIEHLSELIFIFKKNNNSSKEAKLTDELKAWKKADQSNDFIKYSEFIKSYPNSIFFREANNRLVEDENRKREQERIESLAFRRKFKNNVYFDSSWRLVIGEKLSVAKEQAAWWFKKSYEEQNLFNGKYKVIVTPIDAKKKNTYLVHRKLFVNTNDIVIGYAGTIMYLYGEKDKDEGINEVLTKLNNTFGFTPSISSDETTTYYVWQKSKTKVLVYVEEEPENKPALRKLPYRIYIRALDEEY